nr:gpi transamidase component gpi16 [Quercus suber]
MKLCSLLALPTCLVSAVLASYNEHLHLRPLPGGYLYAGFNFTGSTTLQEYNEQNFRHFPRSLGQILQHTHTSELHLRFALGRWDEESWGSRPRAGTREGGTGVEIWAWIGGEGKESVEARWNELVNSLSGLFCASLNFIDGTKTTRPGLSFEPEGTRLDRGRSQLLHGTLPHEVVCTENLTPFLKLLPCKGKAGISSLLDGHKVFDANWQTMAIDVRPVCPKEGQCMLEIQQTVDMVLDIERAMRTRDDPIPRPRPISEIQCDGSKAYNSGDTCYPKALEGEMGWTLSGVFGQPVKGHCRPDSSVYPDLTLETPPERIVELLPDAQVLESPSTNVQGRMYQLNNRSFDFTLPPQILPAGALQNLTQLALTASRQITGYGQQRGGMHTLLTNPRPYTQRIVYLESLPWFLRPFMHTLHLSHARAGARVERMYYTPAIDRERGSQIELLISVPPHTTCELSYDFEKANLRYTEYPPDANRGFDVAAAIIRVLPPDAATNATAPAGDAAAAAAQGEYLRTTSLLLPLPTPDFSMPYNVIILTSTVIALGFGSIFNLLVRRFLLVEEVPVSPLAEKVKAAVARVQTMFRKGKETPATSNALREKRDEDVAVEPGPDDRLKKDI